MEVYRRKLNYCMESMAIMAAALESRAELGLREIMLHDTELGEFMPAGPL